MICPKCQGLMVCQNFSNRSLNFEGWKCVNCGKIIEKKENSIKDNVFTIFYQREKIKNQS